MKRLEALRYINRLTIQQTCIAKILRLIITHDVPDQSSSQLELRPLPVKIPGKNLEHLG